MLWSHILDPLFTYISFPNSFRVLNATFPRHPFILRHDREGSSPHISLSSANRSAKAAVGPLRISLKTLSAKSKTQSHSKLARRMKSGSCVTISVCFIKICTSSHRLDTHRNRKELGGWLVLNKIIFTKIFAMRKRRRSGFTVTLHDLLLLGFPNLMRSKARLLNKNEVFYNVLG